MTEKTIRTNNQADYNKNDHKLLQPAMSLYMSHIGNTAWIFRHREYSVKLYSRINFFLNISKLYTYSDIFRFSSFITDVL